MSGQRGVGDVSLRGKVVMITGAARGIGAGSARLFAAAGARVALVGLEGEVLREVAAECGDAASAWQADVTDAGALDTVVADIVARYGGIDVVVANAGIAPTGFVRSMDPAAFERTVEVNLLGVWRTVRSALPHVIDRRGYVLVISSAAAIAHFPGMAAYCASKAGVEAFADCLRAEVRHLGVGVGVAYFSWIGTDMVRAADAHPVFGPMRRSIPGPFGRTYPPERAAAAVVRATARRARSVEVPGSVRLLRWCRGVFGPLSELGGRRLAQRVDEATLADVAARGALASRPVGPGGAAAVHAVDAAEPDTASGDTNALDQA
jgi:NAD(P)-dependent dehydrogenase (short-subunit alcohol dehydrogenase family)